MKRNLMATLAAALISSLILLGCSGQGQATAEPGESNEELTTKLDDVTKGNATLRAELEDVAEENTALRAELDDLKSRVADKGETVQESPAPGPTPMSRATSAGPGICERTPEVQQLIVDTLRIMSCRLITEDELYRITAWRSFEGVPFNHVQASTLQAGDFDGLVNMRELKVSAQVIEAGTFAGMRFEHLTVYINHGTSSGEISLDKQGAIENGAFDGAHVDHLTIRLAHREGGPEYGYYEAVQLPSLPATLKGLLITGDLRRLDWTVFQALPELEYLTLSHDQERPDWNSDVRPPITIVLPADAFAENHKLQSLYLKHDSSYGYRVRTFRVDVGLLAGHEHLAHLTIDNLKLPEPRPDGLPIQFHPDSPAADYVAEQGTKSSNYWYNGTGFRVGGG